MLMTQFESSVRNLRRIDMQIVSVKLKSGCEVKSSSHKSPRERRQM